MLTFALALALAVGVAAQAQAAPHPFYGISSQTALERDDYQRMGKADVGTLRSMLSWATVDPTKAQGDYNWGDFDSIVAESARNGITVLPFVFGSPKWVASGLDRRSCASRCELFAPRGKAALDAWGRFVDDAVDRYGRGGEFWAENPGLPKRPIRAWEVWNEQNSPKYFAPKVNVKSYAKLVRSAGKAIKSVDPGAEVMLGGMWGPGSLKQRGKGKKAKGKKPPVTIFTGFMDRLYQREGAKRTFDSLAIHPYSASVSGMMEQLREARRVAKRAGDRMVGIWITEIGWASGGPEDEPYNKGDLGQATRLTDAYQRLEQARRALRLRGVFWYSWRDMPGGDQICAWCGHAGLLNVDGSGKRAWDAFVSMAAR